MGFQVETTVPSPPDQSEETQFNLSNLLEDYFGDSSFDAVSQSNDNLESNDNLPTPSNANFYDPKRIITKQLIKDLAPEILKQMINPTINPLTSVAEYCSTINKLQCNTDPKCIWQNSIEENPNTNYSLYNGYCVDVYNKSIGSSIDYKYNLSDAQIACNLDSTCTGITCNDSAKGVTIGKCKILHGDINVPLKNNTHFSCRIKQKNLCTQAVSTSNIFAEQCDISAKEQIRKAEIILQKQNKYPKDEL